VPLGPGLARRVKRFADRGRRDSSSDRLFLTLRRVEPPVSWTRSTESAVEQVIRALGQVAGIQKRVYPHLLRHSFATDYPRRGGNPILLQQILGHSSLAMITQTYQHLTFSDAHEGGRRQVKLPSSPGRLSMCLPGIGAKWLSIAIVS
jgi:site-specific recombinase XerD